MNKKEERRIIKDDRRGEQRIKEGVILTLGKNHLHLKTKMADPHPLREKGETK
jgi:hypothetical protein